MLNEINKLAEKICPLVYNHNDCETCELYDNKHCLPLNIAKLVINEHGYRKQSEWISVEDDTPKNSLARVQVFLRDADITDGIGFPKIDTDRYIDGKWVRWGKYVTHWKPLPEPPKKGVEGK